MCLGIPMKIVEVRGNEGTAELQGVRRTVRLDLVPATVGEHVLVHAGYAIQVIDEAEAEETLRTLALLLGPDGDLGDAASGP